MLDRLAFALGVAVITLLPAWDAIGALPPHATSLAAWAWMLGATALVAIAVVLAAGRRGVQRAVAVLVLAVVLAPLLIDTAMFVADTLRDALVRAAGAHYRSARAAVLLLGVVLAVGLAIWARRGPWPKIRRRGIATVSLLAPLPLVVALGALWPAADEGRDGAAAAPAARRLVVLVFDELDATEVARSAADLPNLRRLSALGLNASSMFPPANYTAESLPALLSGEDYEVAKAGR
jgi:hypothetical protein